MKSRTLRLALVAAITLAVLFLFSTGPSRAQEFTEESLAKYLSDRVCGNWAEAKKNFTLLEKTRGVEIWKSESNSGILNQYFLFDSGRCWTRIFADDFVYSNLESMVVHSLDSFALGFAFPGVLASYSNELIAEVERSCGVGSSQLDVKGVQVDPILLGCYGSVVEGFLKRFGLWQFNVDPANSSRLVFVLTYSGKVVGGTAQFTNSKSENLRLEFKLN